MAKVLKDFRCKITKRIYRTGDEYDGDRTDELAKLGYAAAEQSNKPKRKRKDSE